MAKQRKSRRAKGRKKRAPRVTRPRTARRERPPLTVSKSALTIRFKSERELQRQLEGMLLLFRVPAPGPAERAAPDVDSCLSLFPAIDVVAEALAPKNFLPSEKLGETYLTSQERELFRARVVDGVEARNCRIDASDVPMDEGTTHSDVVSAVREHAHA